MKIFERRTYMWLVPTKKKIIPFSPFSVKFTENYSFRKKMYNIIDFIEPNIN